MTTIKPAHLRLADILAGTGDRVHWPHILGLLDEIGRSTDADAEAVLIEAIKFEGEIRLDPGPGYPHSMPPEELLKLLALQILARKDLSGHRKLIRHMAKHARSDRVREAARQLARAKAR